METGVEAEVEAGAGGIPSVPGQIGCQSVRKKDAFVYNESAPGLERVRIIRCIKPLCPHLTSHEWPL